MLHRGVHREPAPAHLLLKAVEDAVFHNGLQRQLGNQALFRFRLGVQLKGEQLRVPNLHDHQIVSDVFQFPAQRDNIVFLVQIDPQNLAEGGENIRYLIAAVQNCHHVHRLQGIVHKMGVDLALKRVELRFLLAQLGQVDLLDQVLDIGNHVVEASGQPPDLVVPVRPHHHLHVALLHTGHGGLQIPDRRADVP